MTILYWDRPHPNAFPPAPSAKQEMHLLKEQNSRELHQPSTSKVFICLPRPKDSPHHTHPSKNHRTRKQLFGGFTDDNVEVPLSYSPKACKSHDDSSANTGPDQSDIGPNYEETQELLASNGLGDFLPKLYQALVNV